MTFDELKSLSMAVRATKIKYNYFKRELSLIITPEYGYKESIKGKTFQLKLQDCIYIACSNLSILADEMDTEFIAWGKNPYMTNKNFSAKDMLYDFLSRTIDPQFNKRVLEEARIKHSLNEYEYYYFLNVFGDVIEVLASKSNVEELV